MLQNGTRLTTLEQKKRELRRIHELLSPHIQYGMYLDSIFITEKGDLVATLKSNREYNGAVFTYDVPIHPVAATERPRQVGKHISEEAAKVLQASLDAGDVETA